MITAVVTCVGCALGDDRIWAYYPGMYWSRFLMALAWCPLHIEGLEHLTPGQSYILAANHNSYFDVFAIYGWIRRPFKFIMKKELRSIPFVGIACEKAGFIYINQKGGKQSLQSIEDAKTKLNGGRSLMIFPEGSRSPNGELGRFKRGGFEIARATQLPVVPISIQGTYEIMPKGRKYILPHRVKVTVHKPVAFQPVNEEEELALIQQVRSTIQAGLA